MSWRRKAPAGAATQTTEPGEAQHEGPGAPAPAESSTAVGVAHAEPASLEPVLVQPPVLEPAVVEPAVVEPSPVEASSPLEPTSVELSPVEASSPLGPTSVGLSLAKGPSPLEPSLAEAAEVEPSLAEEAQAEPQPARGSAARNRFRLPGVSTTGDRTGNEDSTQATAAGPPYWRSERVQSALGAGLALVCAVALLLVWSHPAPRSIRTTHARRTLGNQVADPPGLMPGDPPANASAGVATAASATTTATAAPGAITGTTLSMSGLPVGTTETDDGPPAKGAALPPAIVEGLTATATPAGLSLFGDPAGAAALGSFAYQPNANGSIVEDPAWVKANITTETVPILGPETCNRLMFPQLIGALTELQNAGLSGLVNASPPEVAPSNCWEPRYVDSDPLAAISYHAWGIAIDLNRTFNPEGSPSHQDPRLVAILQSWGFRWGGTWTKPDPMHFELQTIALPSNGSGAVAASIGVASVTATLAALPAASLSPSSEPAATPAPSPSPMGLTVSASATSVSLGNPLSVQATITNGAALGGGTLSFNLYGPNDPTCQNAPAFAGAQIPGAQGAYGFGPVAPASAGDYQWVVSYSGDGVNPPLATGCSDNPVTVTP